MKTDTTMLELIARMPLIRTMQLADKLDLDIEQAERQLHALVDRGCIIGSDVAAPNGRKATGFDFTPAFKETDEYMAVMARLAEAGPAACANQPAVAAKLTNEGRATAYIVEHGGTATTSELHKFLGLKPTDTVSTFLRGALVNNRLVKTEKHWTIGTGAPAETKDPAPAPTGNAVVYSMVRELNKQLPPAAGAATVPERKPAEKVLANDCPSTFPSARPVAMIDKTASSTCVLPTPRLSDLKLPLDAARPESSLRFGTWSDGTLEINRDGKPLVVLTASEIEAMVVFIDRTNLFGVPA